MWLQGQAHTQPRQEDRHRRPGQQDSMGNMPTRPVLSIKSMLMNTEFCEVMEEESNFDQNLDYE